MSPPFLYVCIILCVLSINKQTYRKGGELLTGFKDQQTQTSVLPDESTMVSLARPSTTITPPQLRLRPDEW